MSRETVAAEPVEAVIISGPRKGEIIRLGDGEPVLTAAEEAAIERLAEAMACLAQSARAAREEADGLLQDLRAIRTH